MNSNAIPIDRIDYKTRISEQLEQDNEVIAILLAQTYIEGLLTQWLFITGNITKHKKNITDKIERFGLANILTIHLVLGNINYEMFNQIKSLSEFRNLIAHKLAFIEYNDSLKRKAKNIAVNSIEICSGISGLFNKYLDNKSKEVISRSG